MSHHRVRSFVVVHTVKKKYKTAHRKKAISVSGAAYRNMRAWLPNVGGFTDRVVREALDDPHLAMRIVERIKAAEAREARGW
jgi:hypothetical protein